MRSRISCSDAAHGGSGEGKALRTGAPPTPDLPIYVASLGLLTAMLSRTWRSDRARTPLAPAGVQRKLNAFALAVLIIQIGLGAAVRHFDLQTHALMTHLTWSVVALAFLLAAGVRAQKRLGPEEPILRRCGAAVKHSVLFQMTLGVIVLVAAMAYHSDDPTSPVYIALRTPQAMQRALDALSPEFRAAVVLCDIEDLSYEVLVMENGSTDDTAAIARKVAGKAAVDVYSLTSPDYGGAMREGFLKADGDWVVNFDIDYFSARFLESVLDLDERADIVIASKRDPESDDRRSWLRRLATWVFNLLLRGLFSSNVTDTHGMKAFRRSLVEEVVPAVVSRQDLFDTELVLRAERSSYRIVEVPVIVEEIRPARSLLKRVPRTLRGLWTIRRILGSSE